MVDTTILISRKTLYSIITTLFWIMKDFTNLSMMDNSQEAAELNTQLLTHPYASITNIRHVGIIGVIYTCGHGPFICIIRLLVITPKAILYSFIALLGVIKVPIVNFNM